MVRITSDFSTLSTWAGQEYTGSCSLGPRQSSFASENGVCVIEMMGRKHVSPRRCLSPHRFLEGSLRHTFPSEVSTSVEDDLGSEGIVNDRETVAQEGRLWNREYGLMSGRGASGRRVDVACAPGGRLGGEIDRRRWGGGRSWGMRRQIRGWSPQIRAINGWLKEPFDFRRLLKVYCVTCRVVSTLRLEVMTRTACLGLVMVELRRTKFRMR